MTVPRCHYDNMWKRVCEHSAKYLLFFVPLKKVTVSNGMRVNTWWQNFYLWMNYPFKEVKYDQIMWIYFSFWGCWQPLPLLLELWSREQIWFCNMHHNDYKNHLKQVFQGDDIKRQAHIVLVLFLPFFAFSSLVLIEASFSDEQELVRRNKKDFSTIFFHKQMPIYI